MESQPQNPEFRNNPENFHPCNGDEYNNDVEVNLHQKQILNLTLACDLDLGYTNIGHICNKYCLVMV